MRGRGLFTPQMHKHGRGYIDSSVNDAISAVYVRSTVQVSRARGRTRAVFDYFSAIRVKGMLYLVLYVLAISSLVGRSRWEEGTSGVGSRTTGCCDGDAFVVKRRISQPCAVNL
ncbi:hypothetical protein EVAR_94677_1 [Eumeta japonica]|uniref:Uncharacterized protein n=1 Tax=Eumeta variegata TaxID=151549 RepID=A0A4C1UWV1_EUMVA|nr:hypothetical protein EVAR_94677_1 [Eumeta japonica]